MNKPESEVFVLGEPLPLGPRLEDLANCATCRYATAVNLDGEFFCRHDPPWLDPACGEGHGNVRGVWPVVFHDDLCGRYWPKEPLHADDALVQAYRANLAHDAALEALRAATATRQADQQRTATGRKVIHVKSSTDGAKVSKVTTP
ncbi:hypothetical protein AWB81_03758 [Caballeronia arationis]|jgi:hypothetical protein|uniref:Uncharacterized protein n=1 Tax=Caballeronia arationis TaxID=1777142 RepID=A0A7Z7IDK9_9BURK|nr:hypothetical protein [Caballeronia arationis]SAK77743.1 hypothetical protein AWB81_03758 [Caballeronia arationis]SOE88800.1 hypothetical protein SAMN05446927_7423 [Caballeronia arationis]